MRFEDLDVWKRSARLSAVIYKELNTIKDYGFKDQITRSGLSIPSNISEGFERESPKDCVKFRQGCEKADNLHKVVLFDDRPRRES